MLSGITNALFEANDVSWRQAILPVKDGGLGFRSAVHVHVASLLTWHLQRVHPPCSSHLTISFEVFPFGIL